MAANRRCKSNASLRSRGLPLLVAHHRYQGTSSTTANHVPSKIMSHQSKQQIIDSVEFVLSMHSLQLQQILAELAFCEIQNQELSRGIGHLILISQGTIALLKASTATNDELNPF